MTAKGATPRVRPITWRRTGNADRPYEADDEGARLELRLNDFPAEPLYTLFVDGAEVEDLESWPGAWQRPPRGAG